MKILYAEIQHGGAWPGRVSEKVRATIPDPATMTDQELVRERECVEDCDQSAPRTDALAAELEKRNVNI